MSDASPTYRGFRKQFLYTLWRILCDEDNGDLVYQPEGVEDLSIYEYKLKSHSTPLSDKNLVLKELIQIKDYSSQLTLSHLKYKNNDSFFQRVASELKRKEFTVNIASYGEFGPEILGALRANKKVDKYEKSTIKKLKEVNIESSIIDKIFINTVLNRPDEDKMYNEIILELAEGPASPDPQNAFSLLMNWVYNCCEKQELIDKNKLIQVIKSVGEFISERATHASEWGISLVSIEDQMTNAIDDKLLFDQFQEGMDASMQHIKAGCDIIRGELLNEIKEKFAKSNIVIIHGASG